MKKIILLLALIASYSNIYAQDCFELEDYFYGTEVVSSLACDQNCDFVVNTPCGCYAWDQMSYDGPNCSGVETISSWDGNSQSSNAATIYFIIDAGANNNYELTALDAEEITIYVGSGNGNSVEIIYSGSEPNVSQVIGSGNGATWTLSQSGVDGCTDSNASNYNELATEDDDSCTYTIQTMIDLASPGDEITITEGNYEESLVINKSLTLTALGNVILNASGNTTGISIQNGTTDVIISGFTITGDELTGSGITVNPGTENITIENNNIENILLPGGGNSSPLSYGILCWGDTQPVAPPTNITIQGNNISNVLGSAISLGSDTENVLINGNNFSNIIPVDIGTGTDTSIGVQAELSNGLVITSNNYNDLVLSNSLINCSDTEVSSNQYNNSSLMLSTTYPHEVVMSDAPWWSVVYTADGVSYYELYYNDPLDEVFLFFVGSGFPQNSSNPGCTDDTACNYLADATDDDDSCNYADAGYDCDGNCLVDTDGDGVCDDFEVVGCQDNTACNYDDSATDVGTCDYADAGYDCDGVCLADADGDGVCDDFEVVGCQDNTACNYDDSATDAGTCDYADAGYDCDGNCLVDTDLDGICDEFEVEGCTDISAFNFDTNATDDDGSCVYTELNCNDGTDDDFDGDIDCEDSDCASQCQIVGCTDPSADNFDASANTDDGSCIISGCTDPAATNYNPSANVDDGSCTSQNIIGCTDPYACNYNFNANQDSGYCFYADGCDYCSGATNGTGYIVDGDSDNDGICNYNEIEGCTDETACNFNILATDDDGSCTFADTGYDCDGLCLSDLDEDGICDDNDNCPEIYNPEQEDFEEPGGSGDACDGIGLSEDDNVSINIFPNPVSSNLNIIYSSNNVSDIQIKLMNSLGQIVFNENYLLNSKIELQIDLRNYSSGFYQVQFSNEEGFVKNELFLKE